MSYQPSVAQYFPNRKRPAINALKKNDTKILVLDSSSPHFSEVNNEQVDETTSKTTTVPKIVFLPKFKDDLSQPVLPSLSKRPTKKVINSTKSVGLKGRKDKTSNDTHQADIRKTFLKIESHGTENTKDQIPEQKFEEQETTSQSTYPSTPKKSSTNVIFIKKGFLSPATMQTTSSELDESCLTDNVICTSEKIAEDKFEKNSEHKFGSEENSSEVIMENKSVNDGENMEVIMENKSVKDAENMEIVSRTNLLRKELNLGQIKAKLSRSSRLEEMKQALERINRSKAKLADIQEKIKNPSLQKFEKVDLEIPYASPMKTPIKNLGSPRLVSKFTPSRLFDDPPTPPTASPTKSPFKTPAFQRYQALITEGRSALTLPFKFRALAEMFHCVDTVISIFHNRKETVTFAKLKPAVEEMKKRALTEYQLGQIKTVFPEGFEFSQEKIHKFGTTMQSDKYDLVISPILANDSGKPTTMSPTCLLERKRIFYNTLLDMTKTYHEEFLSELEPPMHIPRDRLTRWHPSFDIDGVPDITSSALPQPPNVEKITSAKDVLERSRSLFTANPRIQRALQRVSELSESDKTIPPPTPLAVTTSSLLKGIPKCLLEKVRAKQAAKAMEAMTRTPAQAKEAVRLTRLPEIARIIRNLFVAEKKGVLPRDLVLKKLDDSYRENLTMSDLDDHVNLLSDHTPGWMTFCNIRKTDYIKLSKNADMLRIMRRLESLAAEKQF